MISEQSVTKKLDQYILVKNGIQIPPEDIVSIERFDFK